MVFKLPLTYIEIEITLDNKSLILKPIDFTSNP